MKVAVVGGRGSVDASAGRAWVVEVIAGMLGVCSGGVELSTPHIQVGFYGEYLRFGVEVGDGG